MAFTVTEHHIELAANAGKIHAETEIFLGNPAPSTPLIDEEDERDLVFRVTGEKLPLDTDNAAFIIEAYENAYYDVWEA